MEIKNENKESKLVFDPRVARRLCKRGFYIIDLKPLRGEPGKSVFVFANTKEFQEAHAEIMDEFNKNNEVEESLVCED